MRKTARVQALFSLARIVERFPRAEVVVVGGFVADEYVYGETERISREAPVLIVRYERSELKAGGAGNAAQNLAALGVQVRGVGAVGDDALGERMLEALAEAKIDVSGIQRIRGRATETKTRILAGGRSTRRQQMLRVDRSPADPLPKAASERIDRDVERFGRGTQAVLASDYGSGAITAGTIDALRRVKKRGVPVCVDSRYQLAAYTGLTMAKPNEPELQAASRMTLEGAGAVDRAARVLQRRLACDQLLVTRGQNGMSLFRKGAPPLHLAAHGDADPVDVTGAGDTVAATYCAALAAGANAGEAARLANVAGALVVRKLGTAVVAQDELLDEILRGEP